jgi:PST family polysaccharide transporter
MNIEWVKCLPHFLRPYVEGRSDLQRILNNTGWLFADRILRMGVGLFVGVWVARYLGAVQFGIYNYSFAFVTLFGFLASLGLDGIVVRDIVRDPSRNAEIMGTSFVLKFVGGLMAAAAINISIAALRGQDTFTRLLVAIFTTGLIFQSFDTIGFWFQSQVQSRYVVWAKNGAFILVAMVKIALIFTHAPLEAFVCAAVGEIILGAGGLIIAYRAAGGSLRSWRWDRSRAKSLLGDSWPLILSGVAIGVYMRIDQLMLGEMIGNHAVGLYSAAIRVSELWYFIPVAIASSVFPSIIEAKKISEELYMEKIAKLFRLMSLLSLSIVIPLTFLSGYVIRILYGTGFSGAGTVLAVHIWSAVFVFLGVAQGPWTLNEGLMKLSLQRTIIGAVANVILNLVLIPVYGIVGAAIATLISQALTSFLLNVTDKRTRRIFALQVQSLVVTRTLFQNPTRPS